MDARPELMDDGIAYVRDEVFGPLTGIEGCIGMSFIADRATGLCILTSAWEDEDAMHASVSQVMPMRERAREVFDTDLTIEEWEVAVMHRDHHTHEGSRVRVTWAQGAASTVDLAVESYKTTSLPRIEQLEGFCSASLLVNRSDGRAISTTTYDNQESLENSRAAATAIRTDATSAMGQHVLAVREFELVMAHLHVPELV